MKWVIQILKAVIGLVWKKKEEKDRERELAEAQKKVAELKAESAAKDVAHDIEKRELEYERETKEAESTPEKKDDYNALRRDFDS